MAHGAKGFGEKVNALSNESFASFAGTRLAIHRAGQGRPVIMLHGLFSSAHMNWI